MPDQANENMIDAHFDNVVEQQQMSGKLAFRTFSGHSNIRIYK